MHRKHTSKLMDHWIIRRHFFFQMTDIRNNCVMMHILKIYYHDMKIYYQEFSNFNSFSNRIPTLIYRWRLHDMVFCKCPLRSRNALYAVILLWSTTLWMQIFSYHLSLENSYGVMFWKYLFWSLAFL